MSNLPALKSIALSVMSTSDFPQEVSVLRSPRLEPLLACFEESVFGMKMAIASTTTDETTRLWTDPIELVQHLMKYERIVCFNGKAFDLILLATEIVRLVNPDATATHQQILDSNEFCQTYEELCKRAYDICWMARHATGSFFSLEDVAKGTLKYAKIYCRKPALAAWVCGDKLMGANFCIENSTICYNLHHVGINLHKLGAVGADESVILFDV